MTMRVVEELRGKVGPLKDMSHTGTVSELANRGSVHTV